MPEMEFALASSMFDQCASRSALGQLSTTSALSPSQGEMTSYAAIFHGARSQYIAHSPVIRRRLVNGRRPPLSLGLEGMEATGFFFTFSENNHFEKKNQRENSQFRSNSSIY
jgi:hypothetical protein